MRILIAEDDPVSRRVLEATLAKDGYEVEIACDGTEAWEVLQRPDSPRLAVVDWMMPGIDGVQLCRKVRLTGKEPYIYMILLTAKSRKQDAIEGIDAGADDYLTKPFDANELKARLRAGRRILDLQFELLVAREALRKQATHDVLTDLPNRLLFSDRLTQSLAQAHRASQSLAVMFLDLDGFKSINDTLGHDVGDELLKQVADRLGGMLRESDTLSRMGGDEFTIILNALSSPEFVGEIAQKILDTLSKVFVLGGREVFVTGSIGISMFPSDGSDAGTLVRNADMAMYRAKEDGRNRFHLYTEALNASAMDRLTLDNSMRKALERNEFTVYYQPQVDLATGRIVGAESLVRWGHPELGLVMPAHFIPHAEETGLIVPIGELVLRAACTQNKVWQDDGFPPISVAVNVSACQFQEKNLLRNIKRILDETGLDPRYLNLELTESTLMRNTDLATRLLEDLKAMGVWISVDDFGTGYSSLSYLKRFPVDAVKIDQSFVRDITTNPDDAAIAGAIMAMAHSLKLEVVAEGVETLGQLQFLRSLTCDRMQGYFVSKPVPAKEFTELLENADFARRNGLPFAA